MFPQVRVATALVLATVAGAAPATHYPAWPVRDFRMGCTYFHANYLRSENRQHLGLDLLVGRAGVGRSVTSPVDGAVMINRTSTRVHASEAYLVIRDRRTGAEYVFGHIRSTLQVGRRVRAGEQVGRVAAWGSTSHVHYGINLYGVEQATRSSTRPGWGSGVWGWGRAPSYATRSQASTRGWVNLNGMISPYQVYCSA